jgi:hypothetical protein
MIQPDGREELPRRLQARRFRALHDSEGAMITAIATELGVGEATPSSWCKAHGVCRSGTATRSGAEAATAAHTPRAGARPVTRRGGAGACRQEPPCVTFCGRRRSISPGRRTGEPLAVHRHHHHAFEVKWLCALVEVAHFCTTTTGCTQFCRNMKITAGSSQR